MTQDEIIDRDEVLKMARQAGFSEWAVQTPNDLLAFAKLVAEAAASKEREACAKYVEGLTVGGTPLTVVMGAIGDGIRARGSNEQ